jgi:3-oxoacyl-[acyl-carrier protein] reductase
MTEEVWDEVIDIDLKGLFNCTRAVIDHMKEREYGRIINISSIVGQIGVFGTANYTAAKAGVFGFTKTAAREVAYKNITVNALALGYFDTGMLRRMPANIQDQIRLQIPVGRFGTMEEVSAGVIFLASDAASYITGQVIHINGGFYM